MQEKYLPVYMDLKITDECNFHCQMCKMWEIEENEWVLSTEEKKRIIREYAEINPEAMIYFTGGEPFRKEKEVFELSSLARKLGLSTFMSSNGSYINANNARLIPRQGPVVLQFSLDSHLEYDHDRLRGFKGAFKGVINAIDLINYHRTNSDFFYLTLNHIIRNDNYKHLPSFVDFAKQLKVDKIKFQVIHPTINNSEGIDRFYQENAILDTKEFESILRTVYLNNLGNEFIMHSEEEIERMICDVNGSGGEFQNEYCSAWRHNIVINSWGDIQFCAHMAEIWNDNLGKIQGRKLDDINKSEKAEVVKKIMEQCKRPCGKFLGRKQLFFQWVLSLNKNTGKNSEQLSIQVT